MSSGYQSRGHRKRGTSELSWAQQWAQKKVQKRACRLIKLVPMSGPSFLCFCLTRWSNLPVLLLLSTNSIQTGTSLVHIPNERCTFFPLGRHCQCASAYKYKLATDLIFQRRQQRQIGSRIVDLSTRRKRKEQQQQKQLIWASTAVYFAENIFFQGKSTHCFSDSGSSCKQELGSSTGGGGGVHTIWQINEN